MKAMFLTNDMFFYQLDIELQCVRWNENSILWFLFCLHLKSHPHSQIELPVAITNILYLSVPELENSVFLDLVLLCDTAVASYPFYCPSWRSTPTSSSAMLSRTCFWIFLPSGIQSGKETDIGRQHLNLSTFTLLIFRTKQGPWHLMKGSDFPPQDGNKLGPTYPCLAIFYWQSITFTRTVSQESHQTSPSALGAEKQVLSSNIIPWEPNLTHRQQLSLTEEESDFLPLLVFFSEWVQQSPTEHRIWR